MLNIGELEIWIKGHVWEASLTWLQSGSHAMEHVASSLDQLAAALTVESAGGTAASPECKQATINVIENNGDLSDNEQIQIF